MLPEAVEKDRLKLIKELGFENKLFDALTTEAVHQIGPYKVEVTEGNISIICQGAPRSEFNIEVLWDEVKDEYNCLFGAVYYLEPIAGLRPGYAISIEETKTGDQKIEALKLTSSKAPEVIDLLSLWNTDIGDRRRVLLAGVTAIQNQQARLDFKETLFQLGSIIAGGESKILEMNEWGGMPLVLNSLVLNSLQGDAL